MGLQVRGCPRRGRGRCGSSSAPPALPVFPGGRWRELDRVVDLGARDHPPARGGPRDAYAVPGVVVLAAHFLNGAVQLSRPEEDGA